MATTLATGPEETSVIGYDHTTGVYTITQITGIDVNEETIKASWMLPNGMLVVVTREESGGGIGVG